MSERLRRPRLVAAGALLAWPLLGVRPAAAQDQGAPLPPPPALRRSGFSVGVAGGLLLSAAHGFPNDAAKIGVEEYRAGTGLGLSSGGAVWIGGAVSDWLSLGLGVAGGSNHASHTSSSGGSFEVRLEGFPLYAAGRAWQDLGVLFCAGTGGYTIKRGGETVAEGQATSALGLGVFYERWRLWHFSFGPQLEYQHQFSRSITLQSLIIGVRSAFYAGP